MPQILNNLIVDGTVTASSFVGSVTGNCSGIAQRAASDINGNNIVMTYATKSEVTILRKTTATLTAALWVNKTQTVTVSGLSATEDILVSPAPASWADWGTAGIRAVSQAAGSVTFECDTAPASDLTAQIVIGTIA